MPSHFFGANPRCFISHLSGSNREIGIRVNPTVLCLLDSTTTTSHSAPKVLSTMILSSRKRQWSHLERFWCGWIWVTLLCSCHAGIPTEAEFFPLQFVDHNNFFFFLDHEGVGDQDRMQRNTQPTKQHLRHLSHIRNTNTTTTTTSHPVYWKQRFYRNADHFQGPGHPILLILGGEGAIPPSTGIHYPVVVYEYAKAWGALVLQPEHRFYGASQPIDVPPAERPDDRRERLFTPEQALKDAVRLTRFIQRSYGCTLASDPDGRSSPQYCPVVAIGGSYPGWLAAMARLRFPDTIDIGYAASAPMKFYAQDVPHSAYYDHITKVAEAAVPGCAAAVQKSLQALVDRVAPFGTAAELTDFATKRVGVCPDTVPSYMLHDATTFSNELLMVAGYTFANQNMAHYPPSNSTALSRSCNTFLQGTSKDMILPLQRFLVQSLAFNGAESSSSSSACFNLTQQLPSGPNATISSGDWSGVGTGQSGESWDFQTCTLLVEASGFSPTTSMFPLRPWSLDWLTRHCQARFGVTPRPYELVNEWEFAEKDLASHTSHILFTNGLNDGWSVSGIQQNLSDTLVAMNFPNGAHHSDLRGQYESGKNETPDIRDGIRRIKQLLTEWLEDLPSYRPHSRKARARHGNDHSLGANPIQKKMLGRTPPMGWNSWNHFACDGLNEDVIHDTALALKQHGLDAIGYTYVNLDDCWQSMERNSTWHIQADKEKFPSGIPALADFLHDRGLYLGLYSDAGLRTCAGRPGSLGYEVIDAKTYAAWNVDYLKYDNCFNMGLDIQWRYKRMHQALKDQTRPIFFSVCEWGEEDPATWADALGNSWRTTGDIRPTWSSITQILDENNQWYTYAGPGGWNDPDMLEVGNGDLTLAEQRSHFTLWSLMKAPLLLGNDLSDIPDEVLSIINNTEVIAWNQDSLGKQGYKRWTSTANNQMSLEVWAGELSQQRMAVVLFNRSEMPSSITVHWKDVGWPFDIAQVRDVWKHADLGEHRSSFSALVDPHDVVALTLSTIDQGLSKWPSAASA